jgi:uncharacterized membrane protein YkvI
LTILGAVIGAGFASGQEVMQFFVILGNHAAWAMIEATLCFLFFALFLTRLCLNGQVTDYQGLLVAMGGRRAANVFRHVFAFFLWIGLTVMIAGSATLLSDLFSLPRLLTALPTALLIYIVSRRKAQGLAKANGLLMPCLIFLILFFLLRSLGVHAVAPALPAQASVNWFWSGLLYVAFNSAILLVVIPPLIAQIDSPKQACVGTAAGIGLLCILLVTVILLLRRYQGVCAGAEVPMLSVAEYLVPSLPFLYAIPLWIALATTAFADAMGLDSYLEEQLRHRSHPTFIVLLALAVGCAQAGFARLVGLLYPLMGYVCLLFFIYCLVRLALKSLTV